MKRRLHLRMMTIDKMLKTLGIVHVLLEEEIRSTEEHDKGTPEWLERLKMQFIRLDFGDDPYTATERTLMGQIGSTLQTHSRGRRLATGCLLRN